MRAASAMKLLSVCCGGFLMAMPVALVDAKKAYYDYRSDADRANPVGCENPTGNKNRYLQIEVFDYNYETWIEATWTQVSDECGMPLGGGVTPYSETMEFYSGESVPNSSIYSANTDAKRDGGTYPFNTNSRLQMDMYMCVPWGNYELTIKTRSSNNGSGMEKIAWEVEYGPDEYHTWDTLNTPFWNSRNEGDPSADIPGYAPIPPDYAVVGEETTYTWPLPESEGYYSLMYSGPFPPLTGDDCPNLLPSGVTYEGCYPGGQPGWTTAAGPTGTTNNKDPAEPYRMFDGYDDDGVGEDGVMTLEKCKSICTGYTYFGLESAIKCLCGDSVSGSDEEGCGLEDDTQIPEYKYLCSGDSRVLCGTDDSVSVYLVDPDARPPLGGYEELGCVADLTTGVRVMPVGPIAANAMSAEICFSTCAGALPGFEYFGTQYSFECFCAKSLPGYVTFDHDGCTSTCKGNSGETCGGSDALTVYQTVELTPAPIPEVEPTPAPIPVVVEGEYGKLGCAADLTQGVRVMTVGPINGDVMSAEICYGICQDELPEFVFFGTQYSFECFCSETLPGYVTFDHDGCTSSCKGNSGETCGGSNALTVYQIGDDVVEPTPAPIPVVEPTPAPVPVVEPTPAPVPVVEPTPAPVPVVEGEYGKLGCAADLTQGVRVMTVGPIDGDVMSAEICYGICEDELPEFVFFGTQYSFECFCSETLPGYVTFDHDGCTSSCKGNSGETCGGSNALTVYQVGDVEIPTGGGDCKAVIIEAEKLPFDGAWKAVQDSAASGGEYLVWEGLSPEANNSDAADGDIISVMVNIPSAGTYSFKWRMRQPPNVESDKGNDSWLNFPDAERFGPKGTSGSYGGFIKVYGNAMGEFKFSGTADVNHAKSQIGVRFDSAGAYEMQIAGRSHGHQIDQIILYEESLDVEEAVAACSP